MDVFSEGDIIESLMDHYKDFNYVEYVIHADFEISYNILLKMRNRQIEEIKEKHKYKVFQMYLVDIQRGIEVPPFNVYYDDKCKIGEQTKMSDQEKELEEKRILEKYSSLDIKDFRKVE